MDEVILSRIRQESYKQGYQDGKVDGYNLAWTRMSSAEQKRKKGKWIRRSDTPWYYYCSNCYRVISAKSADQMEKFHAFCGTCGADMREESNNAEIC